MEQTVQVPQEPKSSKTKSKLSAREPKKKMQKTRSFTDALREKYCSQDDCDPYEFIIDIVIRGKPRNNGPTSAELAHLRNVVLSNRRVATGGLPDTGLGMLCPNVTDLDLSSNLLESWAELLPLLSELRHLKFLNLSRNHLTRHKEELWRWSTPLPRVENVVLNSTGVPLREVLALARLMPALRELHICCNYYRDLGSVELAIKDGALSKLECLRLNENIITSWTEVWKLRNLPCLTQLILSENPLCDLFFDTCSQLDDTSLSEMDSPDITCHSDGEDSSFGSPRFRYPVTKMTSSPCSHKKQLSFTSSDSHTLMPDNCSTDCPQKPESERDGSVYSQTELVCDLIDDLITHACERVGVQVSCEQCWQNAVEDDNRIHTDNQSNVENAKRFQSDDEAEDSLEDQASKDALHNQSNMENAKRFQSDDEAEDSLEDRTSKDALHNQSNMENAKRFQSKGEAEVSLGDHVSKDARQNQNRPQFYLRDSEDLVAGGDGGEDPLDNGGQAAFDTSWQAGTEEEAQQVAGSDAAEDCRNRNTPHVAEADREESSIPFAKLHTLCLSHTSISELEHLHALNEFPQLHTLRIKDIALFSHLHWEDRRKLYVASLPRVKVLNGSEVTSDEREKAERHYLRHFLDQEDKTSRYFELEKKHGPIQPLFDIDLGARFQKNVTLTFMLSGVEQFRETVTVLQTVRELRKFVAGRLAIPRRSFRMFHFACGPYQNPSDHTVDELFLDSLPMSRFDFMDGDELHVEFLTEETPHLVAGSIELNL